MKQFQIPVPFEEPEEYPITHIYLVGHTFNKTEHKPELIGRFGSPVEAEEYVSKVLNVQAKEMEGFIGFSKEFPFLILEINTVRFEKMEESAGDIHTFYILNPEEKIFEDVGKMTHAEVITEYNKRAAVFNKD